ncbi:radical SAM protein [Staphylococcus ratti]|uniref:Radical SAM protein n=1 Tax=Staphylococcus ratti TaxID=2892440 RepID=A0ABY3PB76_9STAP|nr:radical SAM protein [Staphylococcus ratti]UEX89533.1 radical SAM protein [Staphylococcus ratti]
MYISKYNVDVFNDLGELIIYNSKDGTLIGLIEQEDMQEYLKLKSLQKIGHKSDLINCLYEEGFILDEQEDMRNVFSELVAKREATDTLFISILPTEDCNFRCVYCFEHFKRGAMNQDIQSGTINFIKKTLEKFGYRHLHINWYGGEPLYSLNVIEKLSEELMEYCHKNKIEYSSSITTNGYLLNSKVFAKLCEYKVLNYTVTLDGIKEEHDKTRVLKNGGSTFDIIVKNLKNMKNSDIEFELQLRQNYSSSALEKLDSFLLYYNNEFADDHRFKNVDLRPIFEYNGYNEGNYEECIINHNKFEGLERASNYRLFNKKLKFYIQPGGIVCNASNPNYWMIGSDGKLMRCNIELDTEERNIVGQIFRDNYEIYVGKLSKWLDAGKEDKTCMSCIFSPNCQGAFCAQKRFDNEREGVKEQPCPDEKYNLASILKLVYKEIDYN